MKAALFILLFALITVQGIAQDNNTIETKVVLRELPPAAITAALEAGISPGFLENHGRCIYEYTTSGGISGGTYTLTSIKCNVLGIIFFLYHV